MNSIKMLSKSTADDAASPMPNNNKYKSSSIMMERGSAKAMFNGSPMKMPGRQPMDFKVGPQTSLRQNAKADLIGIKVRGSARQNKKSLQKGKVNLGIDFEGLELGGSNTLANNPQQMKITQSIQVKSPSHRMDGGKTGQQETNNPRQSATITAYGKPAQKYEPEN